MPLTPLDIHNKQFTRGFRGYVEEEVNEFLQQVMKDYEALIQEKRELEERLKQTDERVGHFTTIEGTLQKSLMVAQEAAEEVRRNSQKEAELIVREAEKNADRILGEALAKSRKLGTEIDELKKQSMIFRSRFKMLVNAQLEMIESDDWEQLMEYTPAVREVAASAEEPGEQQEETSASEQQA
ncbi:DivIVA domain-containing protein [Planococcus lenghuensis]|uniref:Septum formation initiator n=1 Tax=Planococcus lenghuensis TaxID=2213202 RepID=A0A1Q2L014_9BACL|nr:DivIVA domain-containing protein [Planococcus lenghuensis]AQQ53789.1 septum formation initiator [Planococcus lenghuensis]